MYNKLEYNVPEHLQHRYFGEVLEGVEIDLKVKNAVHVIQSCDVKDSYIRVNSNSTSTPNILSGNKWLNCTFHPKKEMSLSTIESDFYSCVFKGKWSGRIKGRVEGCDFSEANLVNFAFYDIASIGSNKFGGESTVIIENAGKNLKEIKENLAGKFRLWLHIKPDMGLFVFDISKHKGSEELQKTLSTLAYVKFIQKT